MDGTDQVKTGCNTFLNADSRCAQWFKEAKEVIPYCTSKANLHMTPHPLCIQGGSGCRATDLEGVKRLDCINSFTALIHGHAFPPVVKAVIEQVSRGSNFSFATPAESALAKLMVDRVPSVEQIRFGNSGTEAIMLAIKAARAYTGRDRIAKFEGAYHGYYDDIQVSSNSKPPDWGPEDAPESVASSGGIPRHRVKETLVMPWNDAEAVECLLTRHRDEIAAVLVDPLANRMGFIPPAPGFLEHIREITREYGILVIFDEVISFRIDYGGAQGRYGGDPDLTAFGKIMGGGFPIGATGGKRKIMSVFDPGTKGPRILSGGTLSGNPVSMTAGLAAMAALDQKAFSRLEDMGNRLRERLNGIIEKSKHPGQVTGEGSLFRILMVDGPLKSYRDSISPDADEKCYRLFMSLMDAGVLIGSNGLACLSTPMGDAELDAITAAFEYAVSTL